MTEVTPMEKLKVNLKIENDAELIKEMKDALLFLGADYLEVADINDIDTLSVMLYNDYSVKFNAMGIDTTTLKKVFNTPATLKEKRQALNDLMAEIK